VSRSSTSGCPFEVRAAGVGPTKPTWSWVLPGAIYSETLALCSGERECFRKVGFALPFSVVLQNEPSWDAKKFACMRNTVHSPCTGTQYIHYRISPLSDCLSGRRTQSFVIGSLPRRYDTLQVTKIAGNRAQSLKGRSTVYTLVHDRCVICTSFLRWWSTGCCTEAKGRQP
jgi:hypothetical protein